jgi:hypothetical protein
MRRRPSGRRCTNFKRNGPPWPPDPSERASGETGAAQVSGPGRLAQGRV